MAPPSPAPWNFAERVYGLAHRLLDRVGRGGGIRTTLAMAAMATLAILYFGLAATVHAESADVAKFVKADIGDEAPECSVYFALVAEAHRRSLPSGQERDKEVADWSRSSEAAAQLSRSLVGEERALASIKLGVEKIKRMTKNSLDDLKIAEAEYAYPCKDLMDDPRKRWNYWLEREMQLDSQMRRKGG